MALEPVLKKRTSIVLALSITFENSPIIINSVFNFPFILFPPSGMHRRGNDRKEHCPLAHAGLRSLNLCGLVQMLEFRLVVIEI